MNEWLALIVDTRASIITRCALFPPLSFFFLIFPPVYVGRVTRCVTVKHYFSSLFRHRSTLYIAFIRFKVILYIHIRDVPIKNINAKKLR